MNQPDIDLKASPVSGDQVIRTYFKKETCITSTHVCKLCKRETGILGSRMLRHPSWAHAIRVHSKCYDAYLAAGGKVRPYKKASSARPYKSAELKRLELEQLIEDIQS